MTEYNVYLIDLATNKTAYLYTTLADNPVVAANVENVDFYKRATNIRAAAFHVVPTEDDNRNRDELILDYIIEDDNDTGTADS